MRKNWILLAALAAWACTPAISQAQDNGTSERVISEETTTETIETRDTVTVKGLRIGEKKIELTIPIFESADIEVPVGYRGVDDFFTVREANSNVRQGQFQLETRFNFWSTHKSGRGHDDDLSLSPSIKYGITDMINVELEVLPLMFFDGREINGASGTQNGNGDLNLKLYFQLLCEQDYIPAVAVWSETRLPTGDGSEKMDQTFHLNLTKTVHECVRIHMQSYIRSANGARGDGDRDWDWTPDRWGSGETVGDRRHFQWGMGLGMDYTIDEKNLLVFNYMNRSSNYYGNSNSNTLGAGWVHHINDCQQLMIGLDYDDNHGRFEGPRWAAKAQWSISF